MVESTPMTLTCYARMGQLLKSDNSCHKQNVANTIPHDINILYTSLTDNSCHQCLTDQAEIE